ncbi:MAG: LCP family protein [Thermoleophilaceae bacterium]|nr:LCP family protein [Thermoleophilaceae bacterium]
MPDAPAPEYKVYRSRRRLLGDLRPGDALRSLRREREREPDAPRRRPTPRRVLKWAVLAVVFWVALSVALFLISATLEQGVSSSAEEALSHGGSMLTGSTILVLGSDARPKGSHEPGANPGGPSRSDSIMLLHVGLGSVRKLSILRDSYAEIPGHGAQKINAAYALGGPALAIRTVEGFMGNGLHIDHVMEVSFEDFPRLIDALGGIDVKLKRCIRSNSFDGRVFRLRRGEHHLNGRQALAFARVRENFCAPNEDDRQRAARQQQVLSAMRSRALSPSTFVRLPWVAWEAPRTVRTDIGGFGLLGMFGDLVTGGGGSAAHVLEPIANGPNGSLLISQEERRRGVEYLLGR